MQTPENNGEKQKLALFLYDSEEILYSLKAVRNIKNPNMEYDIQKPSF